MDVHIMPFIYMYCTVIPRQMTKTHSQHLKQRILMALKRIVSFLTSRESTHSFKKSTSAF